MANIRELTVENKYDFFKDSRMGEMFTYSDEFNFPTVMKIGKIFGYYISYCEEGTDQQELYGNSTCRIVGAVTAIPEPFPDREAFDSSMISDSTNIISYTLQEIIDLIEADRNNVVLNRSINSSLLEIKNNILTAINLNSTAPAESLINILIRISANSIRCIEKICIDTSM